MARLKAVEIEKIMSEARLIEWQDDEPHPVPVAVRPRVPLHTAFVSAPSLRVGHKIVTATSRTGKPLKGTMVRTIEIGRGCGNYHINKTQCYDLCAEIPIYSTEG